MTELRLNDKGVTEIWTDARGLKNYMVKVGGSWEWEVALKRGLKIESPVYHGGQAYYK